MHWKRLIEFSAPLWIIAAVLVARQDTEVPKSWPWQISSAYWVLVLTSLVWIATPILLRPLSAAALAPRARFSLTAALVLSWVTIIQTLWRMGQSVSDESFIPNNRLLCLLPAVILIWGIRERLSPAVIIDPTRCAHCRYPRSGLAQDAPCPECGTPSTKV